MPSPQVRGPQAEVPPNEVRGGFYNRYNHWFIMGKTSVNGDVMGISCTGYNGITPRSWEIRPKIMAIQAIHLLIKWNCTPTQMQFVQHLGRGSCKGKVKQNAPVIQQGILLQENGFWANLGRTLGAYLARPQSHLNLWLRMFSRPVFVLVFV